MKLRAALALAVLAVGCGDGKSSSSATTAKGSSPAVTVCGYNGSGVDPFPAEATKVLPTRSAPINNEAGVDGGFRVEAAADAPLRKTFDQIVQRSSAAGWTLGDREREVADAEMSMTRGQEVLDAALKTIPGCAGTHVELTYTPA